MSALFVMKESRHLRLLFFIVLIQLSRAKPMDINAKCKSASIFRFPQQIRPTPLKITALLQDSP